MRFVETDCVSGDERALRVEIFMREQGFTEEFDAVDKDPRTVHIVMYDGEEPVACCRCYPSPEAGVWTLGRVAVRMRSRRRGLASALVGHAEEVLAAKGATAVTLGAQSYVTQLYTRLGYAVDGPEYYDETVPHTPMRKELKKH